jgi:hypothetical protein
MAKSFRLCAEHYLRQWCEQDRELFRGFSNGPVTCELLHKMCVKYQVYRTVPGHGLQRYEQFVVMLNRRQNTVMTRQSVPDIVVEELGNMKKAYGVRFLSAITKAFWMMKRHPVVIYDSNARKGLRSYGLPPGENNYSVYYHSWFEFFEKRDTTNALDDASAWLRNPRNARTARKLSSRELKDIVESDWFRNRVADMRLFYAAQ